MTEDAIHTERKGLPSASGAEKLYMCAGSFKAEQEAPDTEPTDEAIQGSEIAEALENDDFTALDEEGRNIAERLKALEIQAFEEWAPKTGATSHPNREERLWVRGDDGAAIGSAKLDVFWISGKNALGIDDKSGYLKVTASHRNYQLRVQALALWCEYPVTQIRVGTAQYRFKGHLDICDYDLKALQMAKKEYEFAWWRAQQPHAPRVPGPWCRYCKAAGFNCPENAAYALLPATVLRGDLSVEEAVAMLSPEKLAFLKDRAAIIRKTLDAVENRMRALPKDVLNAVGWDLGKEGSSREITDIQKCWSMLFQEGMTEEEFRSVCKAVIGRIETVMVPKIRASRPSVTSNEVAKKIVGKLIEPAVETKPKAAPLVAYKKQIE